MFLLALGNLWNRTRDSLPKRKPMYMEKPGKTIAELALEITL